MGPRRDATCEAAAHEAWKIGRLRARHALQSGYVRREFGGVMVHMARAGRLLGARNGIHRSALSKALSVTIIRVVSGVIHPDAPEAGILMRLRQPPPDDPWPP